MYLPGRRLKDHMDQELELVHGAVSAAHGDLQGYWAGFDEVISALELPSHLADEVRTWGKRRLEKAGFEYSIVQLAYGGKGTKFLYMKKGGQLPRHFMQSSSERQQNQTLREDIYSFCP
jgi:hypothetical protein